MTQDENKGGNGFFDEMYKLAGAAMNTAFSTGADMKKQFEDMIEDKIHAVLTQYGFVTSEEFEVVRKMAQATREGQESIEARLAALEKKG